MRILVVGASGAIGRYLVPLLVARGDVVPGTSRSAAKHSELRARGAQPVALHVLDAEAVRRVVAETGPELVVYEATALSRSGGGTRNFDANFEPTNRLRTQGIDK